MIEELKSPFGVAIGFKFSGKLLEDRTIALVGEKTWEEWMAKVRKPFTMAQVKYFVEYEIVAAWEWLSEAKASVRHRR